MIQRSDIAVKVCLLFCAAAAIVSGSACAAEPIDLQQLKADLDGLKATQAQTQAKIEAIERLLTAAGLASGTGQVRASSVPTRSSVAPAVAATPSTSLLTIGGDLRLRYESNFGDRGARDRDRGVLRARLRASYQLADWLTLGAQLATGDPDDPNSTDVTLAGFNDDLPVSLDQVFARATFGQLTISAGKFPLPFVRTDMVWDGDVSPQGVAAEVKTPIGRTTLRAASLYFLIDEAVAGKDSRMIGGQLGLDAPLGGLWRIGAAASYYDYQLRSLVAADAGDFRTNLLAPGDRYLSDFNLFDAIGFVEYRGFSAQWPLRITGDYVHNFGAATNADTGYSIDALLGRLTERGDWRFGYGLSAVESDAVLAAFSHDNTAFGSNYVQHSLSLDYAIAKQIFVNATLYRYRLLDPPPALRGRDWLNRLRLNLLLSF